jgi:hypothetical protein
MVAMIYLALSVLVALAHFLFNVWIVFGVGVTEHRPRLTGVHIASVVYGVAMENSSWPCPLTLAQNWCAAHAGLAPYRKPFVLHYLDTLVAPDFPLPLLHWGAIGMGLAILAVYVRRHAHVHHRPA